MRPNPAKRYASLSELLFQLRHPNAISISSTPPIERNPLLFGKSTTIILLLARILLLAMSHFGHHGLLARCFPQALALVCCQ